MKRKQGYQNIKEILRVRYNKYKNIKMKIDGIKFDSQKEAKRHEELKLLLSGGKISNLELQPKFVLQSGFLNKITNRKERAINYIADFQYRDGVGNLIVEDVKGMKTDVYKLKRKMFLAKYQDEIIFREI